MSDIPIRVMDNETPETNAREWPIWPPNSHGEMFMVPSDFARKLELERNEAREQANEADYFVWKTNERVEDVIRERDEAREVADLLYSYLVRPAYEVDQAIHKMMVMERYKQMKEDK